MRFANASLLSLLIGLVASGTLQAQEKPEFFSQAAGVKVEGTQFTTKAEPVRPQLEDITPLHVNCWQNGVLIVDEPNWRAPQMQSRFVAMKPVGGNELGLYLVDFNHTFCMLKKR